MPEGVFGKWFTVSASKRVKLTASQRLANSIGEQSMTINVNTNVSAMTAQRYLNKSSNELNTSMERLSSGNRINSAKDDAAGL